jgi:hypothetical protein
MARRGKKTPQEVFLERAIPYTQKYFPPDSRKINVVSFDDPHDQFANFSTLVVGLYHGLAELYRSTYGGNGRYEKIMANLPTVEVIADFNSDKSKRLRKGMAKHVKNKNVAGILHNDMHMEELGASLEKAGANDYLLLGQSAGRTGITKIGVCDRRVEARAKAYAEKVLPWLVDKKKVQEPLIIGIPPLGGYFGKIIGQETNGDCEAYCGPLGVLEVVTIDRDVVEGRDIVITDSWYTENCHDALSDGKDQLNALDPRQVLYVAESGPMGNPLVDFSANVTQYL